MQTHHAKTRHTLFTRAKSAEVLGALGGHLSIEGDDDTTGGSAVDGHVHEDLSAHRLLV